LKAAETRWYDWGLGGKIFCSLKLSKFWPVTFTPIGRSRVMRCVSNTFVLLQAQDNPTFFYRKKIKEQNFQKSKLHKFFLPQNSDRYWRLC
jgi:hypothetical protein